MQHCIIVHAPISAQDSAEASGVDFPSIAGDGSWHPQLVRVHRGDLVLWKKQLLARGSTLL